MAPIAPPRGRNLGDGNPLGEGPLCPGDVNRGRPTRPARCAALVVLSVFATSFAPGLVVAATAGAPARAPEPIPAPTAAPSLLLVGVLTGNLDAFGTPPAMAGTTITAYDRCPSTFESLAQCRTVANTTTSSQGGFTFNSTQVQNGTSYVLSASRNAILRGTDFPEGWGGGGEVNVTPPDRSISMTVYPYLAYGNATIVLPGFSCWKGLLDSGNGCQNPVLSWTQDGAYYLNASSDLVYYSFTARTVTLIGRFTPLYQLFPSYAMIPNELFITQDGSYIYSWGTLTKTAPTITAEAMNLTSHRRFEHNFTSFGTPAVVNNGQMQLTGWDGNASQATIILDNASVYDWNLWSGTERLVGNLGYFEANNAYWEPDLNAYVNFEAQGSAADAWNEFQLVNASNPELRRVANGTWAAGIVVNGVNGVALNVVDHQLAAQVEWTELVFNFSGTGVLASTPAFRGPLYPAGTVPADPVGIAAASDRPTLSDGWGFGGEMSAANNNSWVQSFLPGHIGYDATNVSPYPLSFEMRVPGNAWSFKWQQWAQEGQFYNSSYLISFASYACNAGACPINGSSGFALGTIWWIWRLGLPEFPPATDNPLVDVSAPSPTVVDLRAATTTTLELNWSAPSGGPIVNYTVGWEKNGSKAWSYDSLPGSAGSYPITNLSAGQVYRIVVEAWNLHYHGLSGGATYARTAAVLPPTNVRVSSITSSGANVTWTEPPGIVTNDTVLLFSGLVCTATPVPSNTSGPASFRDLSGLTPLTNYSVEILAWNGTVASNSSACVSFETLIGSVSQLSVTASTFDSLSVAWQNPSPGSFTGVLVTWATHSPGTPGITSEVGLRVLTTYTVAGLAAQTEYWISVSATNGTFVSPPLTVQGTTQPILVGNLTRLAATATTNDSVQISWVDPPLGELTGIDVMWATHTPNVTGPETEVQLSVVTTYNVTGLRAETEYWISVWATLGTRDSIPLTIRASTLPATPAGGSGGSRSSGGATSTFPGAFGSGTLPYLGFGAVGAAALGGLLIRARRRRRSH